MNNDCEHKWYAPFLLPPETPGRKVAWVKQVCVLEKGHTGDHRSVGKVTASSGGMGG